MGKQDPATLTAHRLVYLSVSPTVVTATQALCKALHARMGLTCRTGLSCSCKHDVCTDLPGWHLIIYHVSQAEADWSHLPATASDQQRTIVLSVTDGEDLIRSVQDISRMPFTESVSLYTVGFHHTLITCRLPSSLAATRHSKDNA